MSDVMTGEQLAAITREMVRIKAQHYGRGASEAKTYQCDQFVFSVLKGGMTTVEEDLLAHGDADLVRQVRLRFQENNGLAFTDAVERVSGRRVLSYHSQVLFDPHYTIEMFVLDAGPTGQSAGAMSDADVKATGEAAVPTPGDGNATE